MPTKFKSPYATSFTTAVKNGTPWTTVVWNISKKTNKPVSTIWNSLCKAGVCNRQKFNGTWVYWPTFQVKKNTTSRNTTQTTMWQNFVEWCMVSGCCTPTQLNNKATSQKNFMNYCRTFFGKQFTTNGTTKKSKRTWKRRSTTTKARKTTPKTKWTTKWSKKRTTTPWRTYKTTPTTWNRTSTNYKNYKFPTFKTRTGTRRYVRAA